MQMRFPIWQNAITSYRRVDSNNEHRIERKTPANMTAKQNDVTFIKMSQFGGSGFSVLLAKHVPEPITEHPKDQYSEPL